MREAGAIALGLLWGCGARHAPPAPLPVVSLEIGVEQAIIADGELLLVGMTIGTSSPDGVIVDQVDASALLQGADLGELALVPMMEARMPPWTLMLMWRIPDSSELDIRQDSSIAGTVTWRAQSDQVQRSVFELPLQIASPELPGSESPPEMDASPEAPSEDVPAPEVSP